MNCLIDNIVLGRGRTVAPPAFTGVVKLTRFSVALGLSFLIHAALFSIPEGRIGWSSSQANLFVGSDPNKFGQITIHLDQSPLNSQNNQLPRSKGVELVLQEVVIPRGLDGDINVNEGGASIERKEMPHEKAHAIGLPTPYYYRSEELDQRARILSEIDPNLGDLIEAPGTGKAILLLWINEEGGVDRSEFQSSTLDPHFESAVQKQFGSAYFQPAEIGRTSVKSLMKIEVELLPQSNITQPD